MLKSPCITCQNNGKDKDARQCAECDLRVAYVRELNNDDYA